METQKIRIDKIKPYWRNPLDHTNTIDALKVSINKYGFQVPLVLDKDHIIITGHARYQACKELRMQYIPCIVKDMSEQKAREYRIADNKVQEKSVWEYDLFEQEMQKIIENMDMENDKDLDLIFDEFKFVEEGEQVELALDTSMDGVPEDFEHANIRPPDPEGSEDSDEDFFAGEKGDPNTVEVICPMCGNTFRIDR